jgi:hypothetical protein
MVNPSAHVRAPWAKHMICEPQKILIKGTQKMDILDFFTESWDGVSV